ncbi:MAG: tetratricopeptide repeat protein [Lysobacteraceae bacterium]|nr:MAG: tetratricopeptide repeat protein [Xanthomonadaceae bacterium]
MTDDGLLLKPERRKPGVYVAAAVAVLALLAGGYLGYGKFASTGARGALAGPVVPDVAVDATQAPAITIAVLPLAATTAQGAATAADPDSPEYLIGALKGGDPDAGYFNDGLSAQFAGVLAQFGGVQVISPESSSQLRDTGEVAPDIGRKLGATHLVQGRAQRSGDSLRMDVALVRVADGATIWFEDYRRPYQGLFGLQDEIAAAVGAALRTRRLPPPQGRQEARPPGGNLDAYDALLRGDSFYRRRDGGSLHQAIAAYERAIALDPAYAHAHARLALARVQLASRFPVEAGDVREQGEKARRGAATALRLAPDSAEAHKANAAWMAGIALDQAGAMRETRRALALSPQDAELLNTLAIQQTAFGQLEQAAANLRRVLALDPLSPNVRYNLGGVYLGMNDYPEAEHALAQALALRPDLSVVRAFQAIAVFQQSRVDEAAKIAQAEPDPLWRAYALAMVYWAKGDRARSDAELQALIRDNAGSAATQIADIYAQRDDEASMFHWLDVARQAGDPGIVEIRYLPFVSRYSADPRFVALATELDLVPEAPAQGKKGVASAP